MCVTSSQRQPPPLRPPPLRNHHHPPGTLPLPCGSTIPGMPSPQRLCSTRVRDLTSCASLTTAPRISQMTKIRVFSSSPTLTRRWENHQAVTLRHVSVRCAKALVTSEESPQLTRGKTCIDTRLNSTTSGHASNRSKDCRTCARNHPQSRAPTKDRHQNPIVHHPLHMRRPPPPRLPRAAAARRRAARGSAAS